MAKDILARIDEAISFYVELQATMNIIGYTDLNLQYQLSNQDIRKGAYDLKLMPNYGITPQFWLAVFDDEYVVYYWTSKEFGEKVYKQWKRVTDFIYSKLAEDDSLKTQ